MINKITFRYSKFGELLLQNPLDSIIIAIKCDEFRKYLLYETKFVIDTSKVYSIDGKVCQIVQPDHLYNKCCKLYIDDKLVLDGTDPNKEVAIEVDGTDFDIWNFYTLLDSTFKRPSELKYK